MTLAKSSLSELCTLVTDGTHDTPRTVPEGIPFIKGKDISKGFIDFSACDFVSEEDHQKIIKRSKAERGDTLFANIGNSLGDVAYVDTDTDFSIKNVALFKPDPAVADPRYLFYLLKSPIVQRPLLLKKLARRNHSWASVHFEPSKYLTTSNLQLSGASLRSLGPMTI